MVGDSWDLGISDERSGLIALTSIMYIYTQQRVISRVITFRASQSALLSNLFR